MTKGGSSRGRSKSQGSDDAKEARSPTRHSSDRRPLRFWQPFNDWWRSTFEKKEGRRPDAQEITVWYNEHAASLWKEDAPSLQETRIHAKCLRSLPLVRDYFRNYRARKRSVSDRSGSMGPGEDYDTMDQDDGGGGGAGGGDPDYALHRRAGGGRSGSRGGSQRGRRRGARGAAGSMEDEDDEDVDGDAVAGLTQLANLAAAAQSASPSRDDGLGGRFGYRGVGGGSDGEGEGRGEGMGDLGNGMSLDQLLAAPALLSPTTAALLAVHRAGLEAGDGAGGGGGGGAAGGLPGDLLQRLTLQAAAVQQQFALAALAHNLAASQQAAAAGGAAEEESSGAARGSGDAANAEEGALSGRSSKRQRTTAAMAAAGGEGPSGAETGDDGAGGAQLGARRSLRTEAEPAAEAAAPSGQGRGAGSWRVAGGDSRQGGSTRRRSQHASAGSGPAGQGPLDEDSLAGLNGLAVAALGLSGMGLPGPGGVVLPPALELLHVPPALGLEPIGREALEDLSREQLVDRVLLLQAHLQLAAQQQQPQPAASGLHAAGGSGGVGGGGGGLPVASPATRLLQSLPSGMSPGQKLNAILAQEGLLRDPAAGAVSVGPAVLGVPLPQLPQVKQQPPEEQASVAEREAVAARAVEQRTPPQPTEVRSPARPEQKAAEEGPSSTAAAATMTAGAGSSDAGNAAADGNDGEADDESMGDPAPSDADEAHLQGGGGAPEVASAPTAVVA